MSRSCVWGGENENCRYCGGSGIIGDRLGSALDDTLRRAAIANSPTEDIKAEHKRWPSRSQISLPPPIKWARCPKGCGRWVKAGKIQEHLRKCTGVRAAPSEKKTAVPLSDPKPQVISFEPCPLCGAKLKPTRIERHMSKVHGTSTSNPAFAELVRTTQRAGSPTRTSPVLQTSISGRTFCPICKVAVNVSRVDKHIVKVHKRRPATRRVQAASAKDPARKNSTLVAKRDRNLDATKLYAHPYREGGRFGSHPSHDGFDDESTPD